MSNGWGNMGDLSAAKEFQQQVLRGDLNDDRRFRGGRSHARGGGDHMSFSFTRNSYGGGVNATGGNWDARLAKAPPAHLFATAPTARVQSNQPTLADDHGDPMIVDEEPDEPHSRLPKSCWGNLSTTTASTAHGTKDDTNITANTLSPVAFNRGLDASNWAKSIAAAVATPPAPTRGTVSAVATGRGLSASNWGQSTSAAAPAPGPPNVVSVGPQTPATSPTDMAETKVPGPSSKTTWGTSDEPAVVTTAQSAGAASAGAARADIAVEKSTNVTNFTTPSGPTDPDHGLKQSRWAKPTSAPRAMGQTTAMKTVFGEDQGRVVDKDWIVTYQVEDGGRIYSLAANKAREAGDRVAYLALHNVAELSAEIVRARTMLQDLEAEKQARDAANSAASQAMHAFQKYHPPHPREIVRENTTFHSIDRAPDRFDGLSIRTGTTAQSHVQSTESVDRTPAAAPAARTITQDSQSAAGFGTSGFPASIAAQHQSHSQRESRGIENAEPSPRSLVVGKVQDNIIDVVSKPRPVQQQAPVQQGPVQQAKNVQQPGIIQESIPSNFDDPRARQMLEDCFFNFNRGQK